MLPASVRIDIDKSIEVPDIGVAKEPDVVPRRVYIRGTELRKYGYTKGCPGCEASRRGGKLKNHTPACRARIE